MPYLYAHALHGYCVQDRLQKSAYEMTKRHMDAFLLGLYGPDVYFGDRLPPPPFARHQKALGSELHAAPGDGLFAILFQLSCSDERAFSYVLGFLCHFVLDSDMHPYIESQRTGNDHTRFEMRQDLVVRSCAGDKRLFCPPNELYRVEHAVRMADALHTSLFYELGGRRTAGIFTRAWRKWQHVQPLVYDPRGGKLRFLRFAERALRLREGKLSGFLMTTGPEDMQTLFNIGHAEWRAPWAPDSPRTESYFELFDNAISDAVRIAAAAMAGRKTRDFSEALNLIGERSMDGTRAL